MDATGVTEARSALVPAGPRTGPGFPAQGAAAVAAFAGTEPSAAAGPYNPQLAANITTTNATTIAGFAASGSSTDAYYAVSVRLKGRTVHLYFP